MKIPIAMLAYCCGVIGLAQVADAQAPVAIVEEIVSKTARIEFMDYLRLGQSIRLGESDRLVIGYFNSCWREVIIGGDCTGRQRGKRGYRRERRTAEGALRHGKEGRNNQRDDRQRRHGFPQNSQPRVSHTPTVYALSPVFVGSGAGSLAIERLDSPEAHITIPVPQANASCGGFVDLANSNVVLSAGGLYRARVGHREMTFKVDQFGGGWLALDPQSALAAVLLPKSGAGGRGPCCIDRQILALLLIASLASGVVRPSTCPMAQRPFDRYVDLAPVGDPGTAPGRGTIAGGDRRVRRGHLSKQAVCWDAERRLDAGNWRRHYGDRRGWRARDRPRCRLSKHDRAIRNPVWRGDAGGPTAGLRP